jgi:hypothetical protein
MARAMLPVPMMLMLLMSTPVRSSNKRLTPPPYVNW